MAMSAGSADPAREEAELRAYLGENYDHRRLQQYEAQLEDELARIGDERTLYRTSEAYLYNLTAFAITGTKDPYLSLLTRAVSPPARILDYGCGIGSDGLCLLEAGYRVAFADFANPSIEYLRWRLARRGLRADIYDVEADEIPSNFELVYAFDVIEHAGDQLGFLGQLEAHARLVLVNLLEPLPGETALHHELPVADLLEHAAGHGLRGYELHHGRSHLVLYEPGAPARRRAVSAARRAAARLRGR
jgi:SAM-dependent methyltransferase